jgi:hypothetical protein
VHQGVGCAQVNANIEGKETQQPVEWIESQSEMLLVDFPTPALYHEAI